MDILFEFLLMFVASLSWTAVTLLISWPLTKFLNYPDTFLADIGLLLLLYFIHPLVIFDLAQNELYNFSVLLQNVQYLPIGIAGLYYVHSNQPLVSLRSFLGLISAIFLSFASEYLAAYMLESQRQTENSFKDNLLSELLALNETLPLKIDESFTLQSVNLNDEDIEYEIRINNENRNFSAEKQKYSMRMSSQIFVCRSQDTRFFINNSYSITYAYTNENGERLFENRYELDDCRIIERSTDEELADYYVVQMRKVLPWDIEEGRTLFDMRRVGREIISESMFPDLYKEDIDLKDVREFLFNGLKAKSCNAPDSKILFERGFHFKFNYFDAQGKDIASIIINKEACL